MLYLSHTHTHTLPFPHSHQNMKSEECTTMAKAPFTPQLHFVLIHGMGGGAWCWYKLRSLMEATGFKVSCLDLKSAGIDRTDPETILSFDDYNRPLIDFLSALPDDHEQVILVGHSAGGLNVTHASYKFPGKIKLVVYVGATMLRNGLSSDQDVKEGVPELSEYGDIYELEIGSESDRSPTSLKMKNDFLRKLVYNLSPQEDCTLAEMLVRPGPVRAIMGAQFRDNSNGDDEKSALPPRVYIKTAHDKVLKPQQQEAMIRRWPPAQVYVLESDHSPFFSTPFLLLGVLLNAATSLSLLKAKARS